MKWKELFTIRPGLSNGKVGNRPGAHTGYRRYCISDQPRMKILGFATYPAKACHPSHQPMSRNLKPSARSTPPRNPVSLTLIGQEGPDGHLLSLLLRGR